MEQPLNGLMVHYVESQQVFLPLLRAFMGARDNINYNDDPSSAPWNDNFGNTVYEKDLGETNTGGTPYGPSHFAHKNNIDLSEHESKLCFSFGVRIAKISKKI